MGRPQDSFSGFKFAKFFRLGLQIDGNCIWIQRSRFWKNALAHLVSVLFPEPFAPAMTVRIGVVTMPDELAFA